MTQQKQVYSNVFLALAELHSDVRVVGLKGVINSVTSQIIIAVRQHVFNKRRVEVPEGVQASVDLRNEHDNWLEGLTFANELTEISGHMVQEDPLKRAEKLLALRNAALEEIKPLIRNQFDAPQTFMQMVELNKTRDLERVASGNRQAIAQAETQGRNVTAMKAQQEGQEARARARADELEQDVLVEIKGLEADENVDLNTDFGIVINARNWTASLNAIGSNSDSAYIRGTNLAYGENFRKDQLTQSEILTREGVNLYRYYQAWLKTQDAKISEARDRNVLMPELRQDWNRLAAGLNPPIPEIQ